VTAICAGGYRSSMATSLLERSGFEKITNVVGGMAAWNTGPGQARSSPNAVAQRPPAAKA
jgi:hydroxyacylglutathione hydrolase